MRTAIVNIGQILSGGWRDPFVAGDTVVCDGDLIVSVGIAMAAQ